MVSDFGPVQPADAGQAITSGEPIIEREPYVDEPSRPALFEDRQEKGKWAHDAR